ncbi:MAG: AMP-binding protein, partial [Burkholderiales bacterium]|nr:AMP-binding protein [Burkholderiales bacterium]
MVHGDLVRSMARRSPEAAAIVFEDRSFTWRQANERINRLANALVALGLAKGERVAILAQNSHRYAEIYFALAKAGLVSVPINWQNTPADVAYILDHSEAKALVADTQYLPLARSLAPGLHSVKHLIGMGDEKSDGLDYETLLEQASPEEPAVQVSPDELRALVYPSGTTGMPKGCMTTHRQSLASFANLLIEIPVPMEKPQLMAVPFFTGFGAHLCLEAPYSRSTLVVLRRFTPKDVLAAIERHRIAHMCVVPTMITALCEAPEVAAHDLGSLELVVYGGSPIAPSVLKRAAQLLKCDFCQVFGTAEAGGLVAYLTPEDHRLDGSQAKERRLLSTGREALYAEIRLVDDSGKEVAPYELGELIVRSESSFSGYWKNPEQTAATIRDGWVYCGDMAYRDADGYIFIADRKKEMIVSGGVNIYPAEIEAVLYAHPAVAQAAVIGVPDERWGEAVKALVELKKGARATAEEIIDHCRERLAA